MRDDRARGFVADIAATGVAAAVLMAAAVHQALAGYIVLYDLHLE